jgi:hypothetical protein
VHQAGKLTVIILRCTVNGPLKFVTLYMGVTPLDGIVKRGKMYGKGFIKK